MSFWEPLELAPRLLATSCTGVGVNKRAEPSYRLQCPWAICMPPPTCICWCRRRSGLRLKLPLERGRVAARLRPIAGRALALGLAAG